MSEAQQLTYGQKAVETIMKPGGNVAVEKVCQQFAEIIDDLHERRTYSESAEVKRMCSVAITEAQTSLMWAAKAITWND